MECPVCQKQFDEKTGRRPKRFCSDACKVKFWNANKKPLTPQIKDCNKPTNEVPNLTKEPPKSNYTITPVKKSFAQLLEDVKNGVLDEKEFYIANITPNQRELILRKLKQ
jgi:hypothetical protein